MYLSIFFFGVFLCCFGCGWGKLVRGKSLLLLVMGLSFAVQVHGSSIGKNCKVLLGFLVLNLLVFLIKVWQLWFQLEWLSDLHETHLLAGLRQSLILWFSAQLPQVSLFSMQSLAWWFQPWHFIHLVGSHFAFSVQHLLLQMFIPFVS